MQIGIRREEQNPGTALTHGLFSLWTFVGREVVHDDNVTGLEGGSELGLDIGLEDASVHRCVDDKGRGQPIAPQSGDEGLRLPVPKRCLGAKPFALRAAAAPACHIGRGSGLIQEDQTMAIKPHSRLAAADPFFARLSDVRAILLAGQQCFF